LDQFLEERVAWAGCKHYARYAMVYASELSRASRGRQCRRACRPDLRGRREHLGSNHSSRGGSPRRRRFSRGRLVPGRDSSVRRCEWRWSSRSGLSGTALHFTSLYASRHHSLL